MTNFQTIYDSFATQLLKAPVVKVGKWHNMDVSDNPMLDTPELIGRGFSLRVPFVLDSLQEEVQPNLPWAEDHFLERVSGQPLNPPPSSDYWPFAMAKNAVHKEGDLFSHTYPERFWCKDAGTSQAAREHGMQGIRFMYGDLNDLVALLKKEPLTRQAYLPVWFPEDTGNVANVRLPCSLGYHFMFRPPTFHMHYLIRSCDFVRHFRDDYYMAARLLQWVWGQLIRDWSHANHDVWAHSGDLRCSMVMMSLHCMQGDLKKIERELGRELETDQT